jgi:hypothetical protein
VFQVYLTLFLFAAAANLPLTSTRFLSSLRLQQIRSPLPA